MIEEFELSDKNRPTEECGVFGIYNSSRASHLTYLGLYSLQHRGQESAGIATSDGEHITRYAGMGKVVEESYNAIENS